MDKPDQVRTKKFWSVLITKIEITAGLQQEVVAKVYGYFIYVTIAVRGLEKDLFYHYLTPPEEPFGFVVPPWFFENRTVDRVTPKDVVNQFVRLMREKIEVIPPRPIEIPWHKIPPSRRKKILQEMVRARFAEMGSHPPEAEMKDG